MKILKTAAEMKAFRREAGEDIGFVPTMGALHAGHLELAVRAKKECKTVVVSIFVNPTQFNDPKDLERYPRDLERDQRLLAAAQVDAVFLPGAEEIYADKFRFKVEEAEESRLLCGPKRPGHFDGVLTVVLKLFNLVAPRRAYFGEKDFQQLRLITDMARAFFLDVEVIPVPTVRESDGLAMSSRNRLLAEAERGKAALMYQALKESKTSAEAKAKLIAAGFHVDYVEEHWNRRFGAAYLGDVRLIDNVEI